MDLLDNLVLGFQVALTLNNLFYCLIGVTLGTMIGVLPGVGPLVTISVLLPMTFSLPAEGAIIMLAGIYYGASYGGSTTAILVNLPGESSSVITAVDGYQMARQGRAGAALAIAAIGSLVAGCVGTVLIAIFAPPLGELALKFGAVEYFSLMVMALVLSAALVHGSMLKGVLMALAGIVFGMVGMDVNSGTSRFALGVPELIDGIDFAVVAMGLFAFAMIVINLGDIEQGNEVRTAPVNSIWPTRKDLRESWGAILRGTGIGAILGILPGAGQTIASFASYTCEKKVSRDPSRFGHGAIEGVAGPESANNAAAQTAFIPTLTLGVPATATMALMLGALMIQGVTPGPQVMTQHPSLFWGLIASMWIGNLLLVILNLPLVGIWVAMLRVPYRWLFPAILVCSCVGIYSINSSMLDVLLIAFFGVLGYVFLKLDCEPAPFILGLVLGPLLEENLRRAIQLSRGDYTVFLTRPISAVFLAISVATVLALLLPAVRRKKGEVIIPE